MPRDLTELLHPESRYWV